MPRKIYAKWIYKAQDATMAKMAGEDFKAALIETKESVSGLDQWKPADFNMLSDIALG